MIKLFESTARNFVSNGERTLHPLSCKIHKEDNGDYYLNIEDILTTTSIYEEGKIIVVPTPWGEQGFRITNVEKRNNRVSAKCWHLFYDSSRYVIQDSYVYEKSCNDALDHLKLACETTPPFTTYSNVVGIGSYRCVRHSFEEAINVVLERWGGHLIRDNFNISINSTIGQDKGIVLSSNKNIEEAEKTEDWSKVVTKLMPVGNDGLLLPEVYLTSDISYDIPYTKVIKFDQKIDEEDYKDDEGNVKEDEYHQALIDDLRSQASDYLQTNCVPQINYKIKANIPNITDVGDIIYAKHEKCQIDILTQVIAIDYDVLAQKYTSMEFGNFRKKLTNLFTDVKNQINETLAENNFATETKMEDTLNEATSQIWSALKEGYVIYGENAILVLDKLPAEEAKNVIMINKGGIGFSQNGINGNFRSAWTIDGTFDASVINVINLTADMIKGGTLKLGSTLNQSGVLEIYDEYNNLIIEGNKTGFKLYCNDGSYVTLTPKDGFSIYDTNGVRKYWSDGSAFHMANAVIDGETSFGGFLKAIPITNSTNKGIGIVSII